MRWPQLASWLFSFITFISAFEGSWSGVSLPHTDLGKRGDLLAPGTTIRAGFYVKISGNSFYCATGLDKKCINGVSQFLLVNMSVSIPVRCASDPAIQQIQIGQQNILLELPQNSKKAYPSDKVDDAETYFFEYQLPSNACPYEGNMVLDYDTNSKPITYGLGFTSNNNANQVTLSRSFNNT